VASTILVKDAIYRVCVILQDVVPQFNFWPERELVQWMNDAQAAITKFLPSACARIDAIKLKPGTRQSIEKILAAECKPGDGTTPTLPIYGKMIVDGGFRNMGVDGLTPGPVARLIDREVKDSQSPNWHSVVGAGVVNSIIYNPETPRFFYVSPAVSPTVATWLELPYTAQPLQILNTGTPGAERYLSEGASTDLITIDDEYLEDIVNYTVARAHMKSAKYGDPSKAVAYTSMFTSSLNAKVSALTGNSPKLTLLPMAG
jgi:hypothetical protein